MEPVTRTVDQFITKDFIPAVKGSAVSPGGLGLPNIVPVGNRQAQRDMANAYEGGYSYWMDLTKQGQTSIYDLARFSIGYTNPTAISPASATEEMAKGYGITLQELKTVSGEIQRTRRPGSIVFSRISPDRTTSYTGGGERRGWISCCKKRCPRRTNANSRRYTL
jgi:hypothetical protein